MKIVQSLWSKPGQKNGAINFSDTNKCGWPSKKYNYISWALSCLQFRKFYDEVELVTDQAGYDLLIRKMELPYTSVRVVLDDLNDYHKDLYALGKIIAYGLQDKPFIHADGDVYIWEKFSEDFTDSALLCQNIEDGIDYNRWYSKMFADVTTHFTSYPEVLDRSNAKNETIVAINAGIIGGHEVGFFQDYAKEAVQFVNNNLEHISKVNIPLFNLIFEQFLFYAMAEDRGIKIRYFNPSFVRFWNDISDFTRIPSQTKYIHTMGILKRSKYTVDALENRLQDDYPDQYYKLIRLLRTNEI